MYQSARIMVIIPKWLSLGYTLSFAERCLLSESGVSNLSVEANTVWAESLAWSWRGVLVRRPFVVGSEGT